MLSITNKKQLTDSIYISADNAIIRSLMSITKKIEIKLLRVKREKREGRWLGEGGKVSR
jgi:hypothetical protein